MLALTVWNPWASLIVGAPPIGDRPATPPQKPVENRGWRPPAKLVGQQIAIHAGKTFDSDAFESVFLDKEFGPVVAPYSMAGLFPRGAVVGVATLDRVIGPVPETVFYEERLKGISQATIESWRLTPDELRWFVGPWGWVFRDRRCIEPVVCKGAQGLWPLPEDVERAVTAQIGARS
jgi:hypothetical protein